MNATTKLIVSTILFFVSAVMFFINFSADSNLLRLCASVIALVGSFLMEKSTFRSVEIGIFIFLTFGSLLLCFA